MNLLNDPSMKEVVLDFCDETELLLDELEDILESLEDDIEDSSLLETYGQKIDRIMGSATTLGASEIATFCGLGKVIGYKSSQADNLQVREVVVAVLFDQVDLIRKMVEGIKTNDSKVLNNINTEAFVSRLNWLSEKFKDIERSSVAIDKTEANASEEDIDKIINSLGFKK